MSMTPYGDDGPVSQAWDRFVASLPQAQRIAAHDSGLGLMIWRLEFHAANARREVESALDHLSRERTEDVAPAAPVTRQERATP